MADASVPVVSTRPASPAVAPPTQASRKRGTISILQGLLLVVIGAGSFASAFMVPKVGPLIILFLFCAARLCRQATGTRALVLGLLLGILAYIPQVFYAAGTVGPTTTIIMIVWPIGTAIVVWLGHLGWRRAPAGIGLLIVPIAWIGLEYLLSEICPPQWGWLAAGMAMPPEALHHFAGVYGVGFVLMLIATIAAGVRGIPGFIAMLVAIGASWGLSFWQIPASSTPAGPLAASAPATGPSHSMPGILTVPGEFTTRTVTSALAAAWNEHPGADLVVLSNYALSRNDAAVRWAREHKTFLLTGRRAMNRESGRSTDTLVLSNPAGETVLLVNRETGAGPAEDADPDLAESPWGKIAVMPFRDLTHRGDTDRLIKAGAHAFIVMNPDVEPGNIAMRDDRTHLAQVRAAEYGVPVLRVTTVGMCQLITSRGAVSVEADAAAPLSGTLDTAGADPAVPLDGRFAPICLDIALVYVVVELILFALASRRDAASAAPPSTPPAPPGAAH
jgi:apolipoprotein N-acyltransferase